MKTTTLTIAKAGLFFLFILLSNSIFAVNNIQLKAATANRLDVTESSYHKLQVVNSFSEFQYQLMNTPQGAFIQLFAKNYSKSSVIGEPELPVMSRLIEIPEGSKPEVRVVSYDIIDYPLSSYGINDKIFPLQPPQPKSLNFPTDLVMNAAAYQKNAFIGGELAKVVVNGSMRGVRLANLVLSPVQYNPVTNTIRVYDNLVVDVTFPGADISATTELRKKYDSPYFRSIYNRVINMQPFETDRDTMAKMPIKYVIVSPPMFQEALQPLVQWKTKKGFTVVEAYTNNPAVGTTFNSIKAYLQGLYTSATPSNPAPTFVLFVGDVAQIPAYNCGGHVSDVYYCEYNGDYLPEVYYGRFSATSLAQLQPQIDKTLEYEQYLMPDPSYLNRCTMIAGADASYGPVWGNGQINYGTTYYFNEEHGLTSHTYLQPEPAGGNYSNNIHTDVSNGVCYANYTAHGSVSGWADPSFDISDIPALQNDHMYGLMVGNCCQTSTYNQECFGEELLRAANKGALGYIGGSNNSYWDEDYYWGVGVGSIVVNPSYDDHGLGAYDRTFHDHGEPYEEWYASMDQMVFAGCLAVEESNSSMKQYYWEIYCLMGDPSLMVYFSEPPALTVNLDPLLPLGAPVFSVQTEPYAYVAISKNNVLHGAVEADADGLATINVLPFTEPGYATVVITKQNRQPFIDSVMVASPEGPYLVLDSYIIKDAGGNNNQVAEFGEPLTMDLTLENFGNEDAVNAVSTLVTADPYVTISEPTHTWPIITSNGSASATDAFTIQTHDYVPDLHVGTFFVNSVADTNSFSSAFTIQFYAPNLKAGIFSVDEATGGNGNGMLDAGETIYVTIPTTNTGHCNSSDITAQLFAFGDYITINTAAQTLPALSPNATAEATFNFTISPDAPIGYEFSLYFTATAGPYNALSNLFPTVGPQIEDYETNSFNKFSWRMAGNASWKISNSTKYEGNYGSMSGTLGNSQRSEMYLDVVVLSNGPISFNRKVSSESGYDFLKFFIDGVELGSWSGNMDWSQVSYPVTTGAHRFSWVYSTDESTLSGQNAGWVDYIVFPPFSENPTGPLAINMLAIPPTICPGTSTQLYAFATGGVGNYSYTWTPSTGLNNTGIFNPVASPTETITYQVEVKSGLFTSNSSIDVVVSEIPATPVVTNAGTHLSSSSATGNQWFNSLGEIPGATSQDYTPTHTDAYYVVVSNVNGCPSDPSNSVYFGFTGLDSDANQGFRAYPNPFSKSLNVDYTVTENSLVKIVLYNAIGKEVATIESGIKNAGNYTTLFDGSALAPGIYTCKLYSGSSVQVTKVIRNH
ncbi:MAG: T9SS type A sorting domain-containing protein [Bacteroidales bacterium]|nr:T9SS type A sorting domain-containing protein [Bacteroidales bacterium]